MDVERRIGRGIGAWIAIAMVAAIACLVQPATGRAAAQLPAGFEEQTVANVGQATAFAFVPDGRILIASQLGQLYVQREGQPSPTLALDLTGRACNNMERGLLGVAVDPAFADQPYIYAYYTAQKTGTCGTDPFDASTQPVNRVSRFLLGADDRVDPASEEVLIDNIPTPTGVHNAGDLQFGEDGYLYISIGDGGCDYLAGTYCGPWNQAARRPNDLLGKILRIASDGAVPVNNPYVGPGSSRCNVAGRTAPGDWCQETYAWGLRNPFRLAFDPSAAGTRFFINDVGQETWEEIDDGQPGADYGWSLREGPCVPGSTTDCGPPPAGMTNPVYSYDHSAGCSSVTGGAFVPPGAWPASYDSHYLYSDIVCQKIFDVNLNDSGGVSATEFATGLRQPLGMQFGPYGSTQALYYISYWPGSLLRIAFTGSANRTPNAVASATPNEGDLPLAVALDATQSSDPDQNPLSFDWDFGDGSPHETTGQVTHTYATAGVYTATVAVTDGQGGSDTASVVIDAGGHAPTPTIESPAPGDEFSVGQNLLLRGSAVDDTGNPIPASSLRWEALKHHATHTHPFLPPTTGNDLQITGPAPEDFAAAANSYLEVRLTATDAKGISRTVTRDVLPKRVTLGFASSPPGLGVLLNGFNAPASLGSWAGWKLRIDAPDQIDSDNQGEVFVGWSDGGARSHEITTPGVDTTYTATFTRFYARPRAATPMRVPLVPAFRPCTSPSTSHGEPLAFGSCAPPRQTTNYTTIGTPDANGFSSRSVGLVALHVIVGNSSTPANEADLRLNASIGDVRDRKQAALPPYVGELQVVMELRATDHQNGSTGTDTATIRDFRLKFTMPCALGPDPGAGSTCAASTTADAVLPGSVVEGKRAIWQTGPLQVYDGGDDGLMSTAPNSLFATQGVFVP